jgi:hypothetical protein
MPVAVLSNENAYTIFLHDILHKAGSARGLRQLLEPSQVINDAR